jgi:tRNA/tmRNA/rRNA uracil-C5-methylase (TrmA/RlmC/RlmD family)
MVGDAIKDCSKRRGIVLDPFCGSGTILIAAEKTGRRAHAMEIDPLYVDVAIRRWQSYRGAQAVHEQSGLTFAEVKFAREGSPQPDFHADSSTPAAGSSSKEVCHD